jgi:hypothetical protein
MPHIHNLCKPLNINDLFNCIEWQTRLIDIDRHRFSIKPFHIKGIVVNPINGTYNVYYWSSEKNNMAGFRMKLPENFSTSIPCIECNKSLATSTLNLFGYLNEDFTDCTALSVTPEFVDESDRHSNDDLCLYVVYRDKNDKLDYTFDYRSNLEHEAFII